ncbi:MAG: UPF0158 family protein [Sandaracinus sp.]
MTRDDDKHDPKASGKPLRRVPIAWEALEDAFENNAPEVHSYLHLENGEVIRIVDGIADPGMHQRVMGDTQYLRVEPVSSREQYRWMERFIATVEEGELRDKLVAAIDGKGAFRRFKDVLMSFPVDRERWFAFRSERLRACMETWLATHGIEAAAREEWHVPTADEVVKTEATAEAAPSEKPAKKSRSQAADGLRKRATELVETLAARDLDAAVAFLEFLRERKHSVRVKPREGEEVVEAPAETAPKADA